MLTKRTAIKKVKAFVKACEERNLRFSKVLVFGSAAKNKLHENSDIDVAFVSDNFTGMPFHDWSLLSPVKISKRSFIDIEPHTYTADYFEKGDPFIDEIKKTGIEVN